MERISLSKSDADLLAEVHRYKAHGLSKERAHGIVDMAYSESSGDEHRGRADKAKSRASSARRPRERPQRDTRKSAKKAREAAAVAILKIDGIDIRDYTVGQCLSAARNKNKEQYILSVLGGMYRHLPHTTRIGDIAGDKELSSIVRQAEGYANADAA